MLRVEVLRRVVLREIVLGEKGPSARSGQAATPKQLPTDFARPVVSRPSDLLTCPSLIVCKASVPSIACPAVWDGRKRRAARRRLRAAPWPRPITSFRCSIRGSRPEGKAFPFTGVANASGAKPTTARWIHN